MNADSRFTQLFGSAHGVYGVLDGASLPDLLPALDRWQPEALCLLRGELEPELAAAAPYLVCLPEAAPFTRWLLGEGWRQQGGIFALSHQPFRRLRQHFRALLYVHDPQGNPLFFRYYDPRVLHTYLPSCTAQELQQFFGPVDRYALEWGAPPKLWFGERGQGSFFWR